MWLAEPWEAKSESEASQQRELLGYACRLSQPTRNQSTFYSLDNTEVIVNFSNLGSTEALINRCGSPEPWEAETLSLTLSALQPAYEQRHEFGQLLFGRS